MSEDREMVFTECAQWVNDWVSANPVQLVDAWDLSQWMEDDMREATQSFLHYGFHSARARNDALMILRAMYYEYFLFQQQVAANVPPKLEPTQRLPNLVQTAQKSAAWHAESRNMLSGHEFGPVCVGTPSEYEHVLAKKCVPEVSLDSTAPVTESPTVFLTDADGSLSAFKWGWRYESVARELYETVVSHARVYDGLGRIKHQTLSRLGASPDGLIMGGPRMGRLLEIKCPISRIINGKVPLHYYCQMQLQAEVCDVDAVDYVEVQFAACPQEKVTKDILTLTKQPWIGKVCVTAKSETTPSTDYKYEYSPLFPNTTTGFNDMLAWTPPVNPIILESCVWYVKDWFNTTVVRNTRWWKSVGYPSYQQFWVDVEDARKTNKFGRKALFVDSSDDDSEGGVDTVAIDHELSYNADDEGQNTIVSRHDAIAKPVGKWIGVESDQEEDADKTEKSEDLPNLVIEE